MPANWRTFVSHDIINILDILCFSIFHTVFYHSKTALFVITILGSCCPVSVYFVILRYNISRGIILCNGGLVMDVSIFLFPMDILPLSSGREYHKCSLRKLLLSHPLSIFPCDISLVVIVCFTICVCQSDSPSFRLFVSVRLIFPLSS